MAEALAIVSSVIAVVQLADRIAAACKYFIEGTQDYPRDLRHVYVETSSLKAIFEGLSFLEKDDPTDWTTLKGLGGNDGPVEHCKKVMEELDRLFPPLPISTGSKRKRGKKEQLQMTLTGLAWPLKASRAKRLLDEIATIKSTICLAIQGQVYSDIRDIKQQVQEVSVILNDSQKQDLVKWLQKEVPPNTGPSTLHNTAKELYEDGTGDWVCRTPEWNNWINCCKRSLWIHGIPGAGKTILASHINERIIDICKSKGSRTACVYYYCYHGHNHDETKSFLSWVTSQLLTDMDHISETVWQHYKCGLGLSRQLLLEILDTLMSQYDLVYIGIDALDESQLLENLLVLLQVLMTESRFEKIQLFATSRHYEDIKRTMITISQPLSLSNSYVEEDIKIYVASKIKGNVKFNRWPEDLRHEVEEKLSTGAKGMFRWVVCQLDILRRLHYQSKIRDAINSLPETLDETYERIFSYVPAEDQPLLRHVLHWLKFHNSIWESKVHLTVIMLLNSFTALSEPKGQIDPNDSLHDTDTLQDTCGCLVSFSGSGDSTSATIAHYTVREFLESSRPCTSLTSWMKLSQPDLSSVLNAIFNYAVMSETPLFDHQTIAYEHWSLDITLNSTLRLYCLSTAWQALRGHGGYSYERLVDPRLGFQLFNPSGQHWRDFQRVLLGSYMNSHHTWESYRRIGRDGTPIWDISWKDRSEQSNVTTLLNIIHSDCFALATSFAQVFKMEDVMQERLIMCLDRRCFWCLENYPESRYPLGNIQGSLVDLLCQMGLKKSWWDFLSKEVSPFVDFEKILPYYMTTHECGDKPSIPPLHKEFCPLQDILRFGTNPDPKVFRVTPLQIAVRRRDILGVVSFLKARADPNNCGNEQCIGWDDMNLFLHPWSKLHGISPIEILDRLEPNLKGMRHMSTAMVDIAYIISTVN